MNNDEINCDLLYSMLFKNGLQNVQFLFSKCSNLVHKMFKSISNFTANVVKRQHTRNICARKE